MRILSMCLVWLFLGQMAPAEAADVREVRVRVAVDEAFQKKLMGFRWTHHFQKMLGQASRNFKSQVGVLFVLDDAVAWTPADTLKTAGALLRALESEVDRQGADVVLGMCSRAGIAEGEVADYLGGCALVCTDGGERDQAFWAARGFARLLGALGLAGPGSLMGPVEKRDSRLEMPPATQKVARLHRDRSFHPGAFPLPAGRMAEALSAYRALEGQVSDPGALSVRMALLLDARGDRDAALAAFAEGLMQSPDAAGMRFDLARARVAADAAQDLPVAWVISGCLDLAAGHPDAARVLFQKAIEAEPGMAGANYGLGRLYAKLGQWTEAISYLEEAARQRRDVAAIYLDLAEAYLETDNPEGARWAAREAIRLNGSLAGAYCLLGRAYVAQQKVGEAIQACNRALALDPSLDAAYLVLSQAYVYSGRNDEAVAVARDAVGRMPESAEAYYVLGNAYLNKEAYKEAISAYERAVELQPGHARAHSNMALAYYSAGKREQALAHAKTALSLGFEKAQVIIDAISKGQ